MYAGGHFGEITELFVRPALRRQRVGKQLLDAAIEFGKKQDWTRLEVCAPPVFGTVRVLLPAKRFSAAGPKTQISSRSVTSPYRRQR